MTRGKTVILLFFTITIFIVSAITPPLTISAQSSQQLDNLGFNSNITFGYHSGADSVSALQAAGDYVYMASRVNYDISSADSNRHISTSCHKVTYSFIKGQYADLKSNCGYDSIISKMHKNGSIVWSTFYGGYKDDIVRSLALDSQDNLITGGYSNSPRLATAGAFDSTVDELGDVIVSKFNSSGYKLWTTYLGGDNIEEIKHVKVDNQDNIIVVGFTKSDDFPLKNAFDSEIENIIPIERLEPFVTKLSPDGEVIWSSYLGGSKNDMANVVAIDSNDNIIVSGITRSTDFVTKDALDETHNGLIDVFLTTISADGEILRSGYLGGKYIDAIADMVIDDYGNIYATGYTTSENFPIVDGTDPMINSVPSNTVYPDAVVFKFSNTGRILWSTYLGGNGVEKGIGIDLRKNNTEVIVSGITASEDFKLVNNNYNLALNQGKDYPSGDQPSDIFVEVYNSTGSYGYSMYFGGVGVDDLTAASYKDQLYLGGSTHSGSSFPVLGADSSLPNGTLFLSSIEVPNEISFVNSQKYTGNQIQKPDENVNNNPDGFVILDEIDPLSILILGGIIAIPITITMVRRFIRNRNSGNEELKQQTLDYLNKIRNTD